jgi:uncharacterized protein YecE (DUF72 family)
MGIHIGTSGYDHEGWDGVFYHEKMSAKQKLKFYKASFNTVEINYSFYHTPGESTVRKWYDEGEADFRYTLKAPRRITHTWRLHESDELILEFNKLSGMLREKCGVILYQLPPSFRLTDTNMKRIETAFGLFEKGLLYSVEFRHKSWFDSIEPADLCERYGVAFCAVSAPGLPFSLPSSKAPGHIYIRLHGAGIWYDYNYSESELEDLAAIIREHSDKRRDVWVYFNNDTNGYAVKNALSLKRLTERGTIAS